MSNKLDARGVEMAREIKSVILRNRATLARDAAGVVSLAAMLVVALHLPNLI